VNRSNYAVGFGGDQGAASKTIPSHVPLFPETRQEKKRLLPAGEVPGLFPASGQLLPLVETIDGHDAAAMMKSLSKRGFLPHGYPSILNNGKSTGNKPRSLPLMLPL